MKKIKQKVTDFLTQHHMSYETIDMEEYCHIFLEEMTNGLAGKKSSLQMIPTYIEVEREIPINEPVIVLDAGGTNFRVATVYFDEEGEPVIEHFNRYPMPGVHEEVTKDRFFQIITGYLNDVVYTSHNIGFCFSYPTEIFPNKDGKLLHFTKEIQAEEVEGEMIGENLVSTLEVLGHSEKKHVVLLNDTVATLLAGELAFQNKTFDSYIGFILGTGTNSCYIESNRNIPKKSELDLTKHQIINIESGAFTRGPQGAIDLQFDESTANPGKYSFEKMVSGAYLGALCSKTLEVASKQLFSDNIAEELKTLETLKTKDVNDFMHYPDGTNNPLASLCHHGTKEDRVTMYYLLDSLIERAAKLTAINIASVVMKSDKGKNPCFPVCITAEGTTFYELKSLKTRVEYYLKSYLEDKYRYYEIVNIKNATLIGAAIAGLTN
jgi:hexokinase